MFENKYGYRASKVTTRSCLDWTTLVQSFVVTRCDISYKARLVLCLDTPAIVSHLKHRFKPMHPVLMCLDTSHNHSITSRLLVLD